MRKGDSASAVKVRSVHQPPNPSSWTPAWVQGIQTAVWITSPDRRVSYINARACGLLKVKPSDAIGRCCHDVVCGRDATGRVFCSDQCPALSAAERGHTIEPVSLQLGDDPGSHWVRLLVIAAKSPHGDGTHLVHCALDDDRARRVESYFSRVILRTNAADIHCAQLQDSGLTKREMEVLRLLTEDESLHGIANRLGISYTTVRNHVQNVLHKLGLHSIMEAVALYLLTADDLAVRLHGRSNKLHDNEIEN